MDNVTHTLIGLAVGEGATQARLRVSRDTVTRRALFWTVSAVANNFPDLDFVAQPISGGKLGYLLQHRGFTHTLLGAVGEALLIYLFFRIRPKNRPLGFWIFGLALVGLVLHISMDAMNSYGVHPLWPFDGRWFYGDTLFIIEPMIWISLLPALALATGSVVFRAGGAALLVAANLLVWFTPFVPWPMATFFTVFGVAWWAMLRKRSPLFRATFALYGWLGTVAVFSFMSARVRGEVATAHARAGGDFHLNDTILSPLPANPFCWTVITVETSRDRATYRMKTGMFAPFPSFIPPSQCPTPRMALTGTAPLVPVEGETDARFVWRGMYSAPLEPLRRARNEYCAVGALMHFARAPFLVERSPSLTVGDLRYDRPGGFTEVTVTAKSDQCPKNIPSWVEPRQEFFR